jgi:hypothetical protein
MVSAALGLAVIADATTLAATLLGTAFATAEVIEAAKLGALVTALDKTAAACVGTALAIEAVIEAASLLELVVVTVDTTAVTKLVLEPAAFKAAVASEAFVDAEVVLAKAFCKIELYSAAVLAAANCDCRVLTDVAAAHTEPDDIANADASKRTLNFMRASGTNLRKRKSNAVYVDIGKHYLFLGDFAIE